MRARSSPQNAARRAIRFFRLVHVGRALLVVPLPVVAEWRRGRVDAREEGLAATRVLGSADAAKAARVALARPKRVDAVLPCRFAREHDVATDCVRLTIDAPVMATAALLDAVLVTGHAGDFVRLGADFPGVVVLSA